MRLIDKEALVEFLQDGIVSECHNALDVVSDASLTQYLRYNEAAVRYAQWKMALHIIELIREFGETREK